MSHKITGDFTLMKCPQVQLPDSVFERLLRFWHAHSVTPERMSKIWNAVMALPGFVCLEQALREEDPVSLRKQLENLYDGSALYGMDINNSEYGQTPASWDLDALLIAGQALGCVPYFMRDQDNSCEVDPVVLLPEMETVVGGRLHWTGTSGCVQGLVVGDRFLPHKLLHELPNFYVARTLRPDARAIVEIGSGCGYLAYLFCSLCPEVTYHIIDLPTVSVISGFLLMTALGPDAVSMDENTANARVTLHGLNKPLPSGWVDLFININSLPEIPDPVQDEYLWYIYETLTEKGAFLSVNHESNSGGQRSVHRAVQSVPGLRLKARLPGWYRAGYLAEIYRKLEL